MLIRALVPLVAIASLAAQSLRIADDRAYPTEGDAILGVAPWSDSETAFPARTKEEFTILVGEASAKTRVLARRPTDAYAAGIEGSSNDLAPRLAVSGNRV